MPSEILANPTTIATYAELRQRVREAIARGKQRALDAVEREKVRTSWEIGKLIHEHVLLHKERADYGKQVIQRLSADLGISPTELYYTVEFARTYPIFRLTGKLPWSHYQALLRINEGDQRDQLAERASKENWPQNKLRREIGKLKSSKQITVSEDHREAPLVPIKGKLDTYRIVTAEAGPFEGKPVVDLGFSNYHRPPALPFSEKEIIRLSEGGKLSRVKDATEADIFTYRAYLLEVTDGDTLWVLINLGFGFTTKQQLRLRGLDAPEINSRAGQEAKRFVEKELKKSPDLVIASTKSDKYDRYLADVFYTVKGEERYLNQELVEQGLATVAEEK